MFTSPVVGVAFISPKDSCSPTSSNGSSVWTIVVVAIVTSIGLTNRYSLPPVFVGDTEGHRVCVYREELGYRDVPFVRRDMSNQGFSSKCA